MLIFIFNFSTVHPSLRAAAFVLWRRSNPLLTRRLLRAKEHRPRNDEIYSCLYGREKINRSFWHVAIGQAESISTKLLLGVLFAQQLTILKPKLDAIALLHPSVVNT